MSKVGNLNAEYVMSNTQVTEITFKTLASLTGRCYSDWLTDGKVIVQHSIPYKRSCFDIWSATTGQHIERAHTVNTAWSAYQNHSK